MCIRELLCLGLEMGECETEGDGGEIFSKIEFKMESTSEEEGRSSGSCDQHLLISSAKSYV